MRHRPFSWLAALSLALFAGFAAWAVAAGRDRTPTLRVTEGGRVIGWDGTSLAFERRAPALGPDPMRVPDLTRLHSVLGVRYAEGWAGRPAPTATGPPDYRLLLVPVWYPLLAFAVAPALWLVREWKHRKARQRGASGLCPACGYDLRASPDRCPECGNGSRPRHPPGSPAGRA